MVRPRLPSRALLAFLATAAILGVGTTLPASAAPIAVDCTADPAALQPAIDAANPGETLLISGTCIGTFSVSKDLTLKGTTGATLSSLMTRTAGTAPP
jgi:nitrous oxidase accessory protein NosD